MKALTKSVPPESKWLFGNDLSKRINQLNSTNSTLIKTSKVRKITDIHSSNPNHQHLQLIIKKTYRLPRLALFKGRDGQDSRATDLPETRDKLEGNWKYIKTFS